MQTSFAFLIIAVALLTCGCREKAPESLFQRIDPAKSGVSFANRIAENDTFNILEFEYVYNGGGVGAADFDGDGLTDLYFTGNTTDNRLYLNLGDFAFADVTEAAGVAGAGRWCSGISIADVNGDGRPDLYVSATTYSPGPRRANLLYLNTGTTTDAAGRSVPAFTEVAAAAGVADTSHTTQTVFFDYDRDGDLDLYVLVNEMDDRALPNRYLPKLADGSGRKNDKLYRNDGNGDAGVPRFTDVTRAAGILKEGYGLGVSVCDINNDGWPDLYVTNDYVSNDLLWINNGDGTFTDRAADYIKHSSYSAMGNDVADLNGDGRDDVFTVDMFPENNLRRKAMMAPNNYSTYLNNDRFGYLPQFARNALQLNGPPPAGGGAAMTEVGMMAGVSATDWSWSPLAVDVDNDGDRDLLITNGFPRDVTDRDFMDYHVQVSNIASRESRLAQIPSVKIANYAYENDGAPLPHFTKRTVEWGFDYPSFSNGAAYADLDNDGDLDYIVNNINDSCFLFRNTLITADQRPDSVHWLQLALQAPPPNTAALGARVTVEGTRHAQTAYNQPVRGFLSSVADVLHFGFATGDSLLRVRVDWPDGTATLHDTLTWDQRIVLRPTDGTPAPAGTAAAVGGPLLPLPELLRQLPVHRDSLFIDFNVQPLLPHKLSEYGPGLAVADVDGDGLDDLYRSGSHFHPGQLLLQRASGAEATFVPAPFPDIYKDTEELGALFFDADGDGDVDLYLVAGGSELPIDRPELVDRLLLNDGTGSFSPAPEGALPEIHSSGSCVRAADFDRDGDLDLFVGGRLHPGRFPEAVDSYVLVNDGTGTFTVATNPVLTDFGLVTDALWTDYNNDGWVDLLVAGQGMPLRLFENREGQLVEATPTALTEHTGWFNSLAAADFDRDGDLDYAVGNFGVNNLYGGSGQDYVALYGGDFDGNGGYDLFVADYALAEDGTYQEFPHNQRNDSEKQVIKVKYHFPRHDAFGRARMEDVLAKFPDAEVTALRSNYLRSAWIENLGDGTFAFHDLPRAAQVAPIYGLQAMDVNGDGYPDLVAIGNDLGTETGMGMLDGLNGVVLTFDPAAGDFVAVPSSEFHVPGNGRSLTVAEVGGNPTLIASENRGPTTAYRLAENGGRPLHLPADAQRVTFTVDGRTTLTEVYYGNGYLSQRTRSVWLPAAATDVRIVRYDGTEQLPSR